MADKTLEIALERFKLAEDAEAQIRKLALNDLKFKAGYQWDDAIVAQRQRERRPSLTINRMPQFIRHVTNDLRMNRPSIKIAATDDTTVETAEILEGLVRHIQVKSNADIAYDIACDNQVTMGFGFIRVITDYCDEESFDQDILIKPIKNPFTVYFDPNCVEPDYSDARWAFVVSDMPRKEFEKEFGKEDGNSVDLSSIGDKPSNWSTEDSVRIAEYFEVIEAPNKIYMLNNGQSVDEDGMRKAMMESSGLVQPINQRMSTKRKIIWRKMTSSKILEEKEWIGKYIPIVPVLGEELDIDGKRDLKGMVRDAQDPARMYNYWVTAQTEAIALAPRAPFIIAEGQLEGYEKFWDNANTNNFSYLPYRPVSVGGQVLGAPQRNQAEPPVQAMSMAIHQASEDLKLVTGIQDASLGISSNETSGKAIQQRQRQGEIANFHYGDNLSRSLRFLGVIIMDLIPKIYDAPRVTRIIHEDETHELVKLNQPTGEKDENGVDKIYDVTTGKYDVVVTTGASFMTKRQEEADGILALAQANPQIWNVAGDLLVKALDWTNADEVAERLKKMLPPQLQDNEDGQAPLPPQVQQQLQQTQQMVEQLTQALNEAHDKLDKKSDELESKERIANSKNETDLVIAALKAESAASHALLMEELKSITGRQQLLEINQPVDDDSQQMAQNPMQAPMQNQHIDNQPQGM